LVPKILASYEDVVMSRNADEPTLRELFNRLLDENRREEGERYKVLLLSPPDSPDTIRLPNPIPNNKISKTGKPTAFTMGQRYVSSVALMAARTTADLD
jgi:hypothetical protein